MTIERTQQLLAEFRQNVDRLLDRVRRDVERLRESTLAELGPPPGDDRAERHEAGAERPIAEASDDEQAMLRNRTLVNEVIDERFRNLSDLIRARSGPASARFQISPSRRKP